MKKYWYRRILIMALVFFVSVGGSYLLIEQKKDAMRREVSAQTSEEDLVIPGGMPVGIYMKTKRCYGIGYTENQRERRCRI